MSVCLSVALTRWHSYNFTRCENMNFLCQGFRKLSSDRQADRHVRGWSKSIIGLTVASSNCLNEDGAHIYAKDIGQCKFFLLLFIGWYHKCQPVLWLFSPGWNQPCSVHTWTTTVSSLEALTATFTTSTLAPLPSPHDIDITDVPFWLSPLTTST